jgi:DNA (cytosine-5)-methyltransferase 1
MNYLDLFSGIGGFALGAYWAGIKFDKHYFSEIDEYAISVYKKRFPDAIPLGDIRKIQVMGIDREVQYEDAQYIEQGDWIITGGFPCQDISIAGKGAGIYGDRSGLWFEYARLIGEIRPRFAIMENVGALIIRGLDWVLGSLAEIGYDAEWQDIRASDVGAPHRRERIWIVAYPQSELLERGREARERGFRPTNSNTATEGCSSIPNTDSTGLQTPGAEQQTAGPSRCGEIPNTGDYWTVDWHRKLQHSKQIILNWKDNGNGTEIDAIREWWSTEPPICCMVDGLPPGMDRYEGRICNESYQRKNQLKGLGNAIVPHIAMLIWLMIMDSVYENL